MKKLGLQISISANIRNLTSKLSSVAKGIRNIGVNIEKLNSKKIDIVANDSEVKRVKSELDGVGVRLDYLKNKKNYLSLQLDKNKVRELNRQIIKLMKKLTD